MMRGAPYSTSHVLDAFIEFRVRRDNHPINHISRALGTHGLC